MPIRFVGVTPVLLASDLEVTRAFYVETLGFTIDVLWPDDEPTLLGLDRGDVHLLFDTGADWDAPGAGPTFTGQLVFEVDDVQALHAVLEGKVEVLWGPEVYGYGRREFSIRDPNGYRLVFSEPTTDPTTEDG